MMGLMGWMGAMGATMGPCGPIVRGVLPSGMVDLVSSYKAHGLDG